MTPVSLGLYLPPSRGRTCQPTDESSMKLMIHIAEAHESTSNSKLYR